MPAATTRSARRGLRAADGGLAQMRAPEGTLISYATQPGNVAQDGSDGHSPYTRALADHHQAGRARIFQTFNQVGLAVKRETGGVAAAMGVVLADRRHVLFRAAGGDGGAAGRRRAAAAAPVETLRPDPDRIPIKDTALLRELSDRLYEHNFDPEQPDPKTGMRIAISKFQEKSNMSPNGRSHRRRADAVAQARGSQAVGIDRLRSRQQQMGHILEPCVAPRGGRRRPLQMRRRQMPDRTELLRRALRRVRGLRQIMVVDAAGHVQKAKDAALDECGRTGKSCRIIGAVCADGTGR